MQKYVHGGNKNVPLHAKKKCVSSLILSHPLICRKATHLRHF